MAVYQSKDHTACYRFFGIRSHLHQFYEYNDQQQTSDEENKGDYYLLSNNTNKYKRCSPTIWKVLIWLGIILLILGAALILIGRFVPRKKPLLKSYGETDRYAILDKYAIQINDKLDIVEIVGIITFIVGGVSLLVAAILPAFLARAWGEDTTASDGSEEQLLHSAMSSATPSSPTEITAPITTLIKHVQPVSKSTRPIETSETYKVIE